MFVFIPGSISPVTFGLGGTDPPDGFISPVKYLRIILPMSNANLSFLS